MSVFLCSICQDHYACDRLRCLPCGHTFCAPCIDRCFQVATNNRRRTCPCPTCRTSFRASDPHPIYLDAGDSLSQAGPSTGQAQGRPCHTEAAHQRIQIAIREVNKTEQDLRHQTVQKAAHEIDKVAEFMGNEPDCLLDLVTAVAARWRGMLPTFAQLAEKHNEVLALRGRLRETEAARKAAVAETTKAEEIATNAVHTTEAVHRALGETKGEMDTLRVKMERLEKSHKAELDAKQQVLSRLHDTLKALKEKESKQKEEIERLRKEVECNAELVREAKQLQSQAVLPEANVMLDEQALAPQQSQSSYSQWVGSEATYERVPANASRKRKGSEDELVVLDDGEELPTEAQNCRRRVSSSSLSKKSAAFPIAKTAAPQPPTFTSDWGLQRPQQKKMRGSNPPVTPSFPIALDRKGRPLRTVQVGSNRKFDSKS
ncbi:hypothetical protein GY45DRAFT_1320665 [Cubamyces sp. BRFM 1775]|nr:hypothetical protein GY45DRAFT_1320665 [Cubamyces sp. BRFM 1775]